MKRKLIVALLSLLASFSLWLYVITVVSPDSETTFDVRVQIDNEAMLHDKGLMLNPEQKPTVHLKLSGNRSAYKFNGYAASVSSFLDYYKYSIELATNEKARESLLGKKEAPIFTRVHNSAPTKHTSTAKVENSLIADECVIEGTVINSVIFRDVKVEKGAVVKNCVLFHGAHVGKNANLNCIVADKDVHVTDGVNLSGNDNMPFYIQKGRKI